MTTTQPAETEFFTSLGVRIRRVHRTPGRHNWLLSPGGPGLGGDSLLELAATAALPGATWLVDLPGDGSNINAPGAPANPYALWPQVLLEAVDAVSAPLAVGHSTGGEYLLSVPALEDRLHGLVRRTLRPPVRLRLVADLAAHPDRQRRPGPDRRPVAVDDRHYRGDHVQHLTIDGAGHWPWIDQPTATRSALHELTPR